MRTFILSLAVLLASCAGRTPAPQLPPLYMEGHVLFDDSLSFDIPQGWVATEPWYVDYDFRAGPEDEMKTGHFPSFSIVNRKDPTLNVFVYTVPREVYDADCRAKHDTLCGPSGLAVVHQTRFRWESSNLRRMRTVAVVGTHRVVYLIEDGRADRIGGPELAALNYFAASVAFFDEDRQAD